MKGFDEVIVEHKDKNKVKKDMFNALYGELNAEAKLNCINGYVYNICAYEHFDDLNTMQELEECVREFFINSEYHLDKFGNWYDEDSNKI